MPAEVVVVCLNKNICIYVYIYIYYHYICTVNVYTQIIHTWNVIEEKHDNPFKGSNQIRWYATMATHQKGQMIHVGIPGMSGNLQFCMEKYEYQAGVMIKGTGWNTVAHIGSVQTGCFQFTNSQTYYTVTLGEDTLHGLGPIATYR